MEKNRNKEETPWNVTVLTLFPEMFPGPLGFSLAGKALENKIWQLNTINIRDFAEDKYKTVDDAPYGGGAGLVMKPDVVGKAIDYAISQHKVKKIFYMTPRGSLLNQNLAKEALKLDDICILCGRFEGLDQRVIYEYSIEEISLGDFILSGGEIAAYAFIDSVVRLLPSVIMNEEAVKEESFGLDSRYSNLLEYPLYTRPALWRNKDIPEVLLSGDHKKIENWRLEEAKKITKERRKDLWERYLSFNSDNN